MENKTLEEVFADLDGIVEKLEESNVSLEDSFKLYHEGMELLKVCNEKIDTVEKQMIVLEENGEQHEL